MAETTVVKLDVPEKIPIEFKLGDRLIDGVIVRPIMYAAFVESVQDTLTMRAPSTFEAKLKRNRMHKQSTFYIGNAQTQVNIEDLAQLPIRVAQNILKKIEDSDNASPGKITRQGNGIDSSAVFELGTAIPGKPSIKELEFHAKTYGDIEDVMAQATGLQQSLMMIRTIAKPIGTSLMALPSWAVSQITMADGFAIMNTVLPLFIESPEDS